MKGKALLLVTMLCVILPVQAAKNIHQLTKAEKAQVVRGFDAASRGDYTTALKIFEDVASKGNSEYQYLLGSAYLNGETGISQDLERAKYWLEKSANQGWVDAQMELVGLYLYGKGDTFKKDNKKAFYWTEQAAKYNHVGSQQTLAIMYFDGLGVPVDLSKFLYWTQKAANNGEPVAQYNLGLVHMNALPEVAHLNIPMDLKKGVALIEKSAWQGYAKAQFYLGKIYQYGFGKSVDKAKARFWYQKAATQGYDEAAEYLRNL